MDKKQIAIGVIVLVIVAAGSFGAGVLASGHAQFRAMFSDERAERGFGQPAPGMMRGGFLAGQIASVNGSTLTLTQPDGSTRTVMLSATTQITKYATGTPADLTQGTNVSVSGSAATDGSVTAQSIQIRPAAGFGYGRSQ